MRRRDLIVGGLLATSFASRVSAQPKNRVRQLLLIGHAWSDRVTADPASPRWSVFLNELRHHGYAAGVNLAVSWREGVEDWGPPRDEWSQVMDDIRRLSPDVIVTTSHGWARALNAVISTIPIVVSALSPIEQEVISSLPSIWQYHGYRDRPWPRFLQQTARSPSGGSAKGVPCCISRPRTSL